MQFSENLHPGGSFPNNLWTPHMVRTRPKTHLYSGQWDVAVRIMRCTLPESLVEDRLRPTRWSILGALFFSKELHRKRSAKWALDRFLSCFMKNFMGKLCNTVISISTHTADLLSGNWVVVTEELSAPSFFFLFSFKTVHEWRCSAKTKHFQQDLFKN